MAAQAGLNLTWSQTPKIGFSRDEAQLGVTEKNYKILLF